jgi:HPt (histidine-containing phosphotransfer) domain-containing protein
MVTSGSGPVDGDVRVLDPGAARALSEMLGGDREAVTELVDTFLDDAPKRLAELRQGDAALAGRAAHTLKSNALTFGAIDLASLCRRLEEAARAGALHGQRDTIGQVEAEWPRVRDALVALRDGGRA